MKRTRSHGAAPTVENVGSGSQPSSRKRAAARPGVSNVDICMTCYEPVDWHDEGRRWVATDHATDTPHRCKETP